MDLVNNCPSISNAEEYAKIIAEKYNVRRLITASREIIDDATAGNDDPSVLIDSAEQKIFDIRQGNEKHGLERINSVILQTFDRLDALNSETDNSMKPIPTGIGDLDRMITGLNRSDLIILAARPGMGKTSFALNIARNVACKSKKTVAFFSLEMSKEQLASRLLSSEALIGGTKLRTGQLTEEEWSRLIPASDILSKTDLYLDDTPGITIPEMKSRLRRLHNLDLVVIDYLQLMSSSRKIDSRVNEISEITRNLKILAKEMNVPVITLSQLSRAAEKRDDHRPQIADLRDSGSIEQDADIVLFLYREGYYDKEGGEDSAAPTADMNSGECIVAKNRHGETNIVKTALAGVSSCALRERTTEMLNRVTATVEKYGLLEKGDSVIVALSGGADSTALLSVFVSLKEKYNLSIYAAHINHNIRGDEAKRDENFCKILCKKFNTELFIKSVDVPTLAKQQKISEELCGRNVRYAFLKSFRKNFVQRLQPLTRHPTMPKR